MRLLLWTRANSFINFDLLYVIINYFCIYLQVNTISGRKRKRTETPARQSGSDLSRWDFNEPENWTSLELIQKLKVKGILLPLSLKKSQLINIYCDNVTSKEPTLTNTISNNEIELNNQDGAGGETLPASSSQMSDNEAGRMLSSGHELNELSAAIRGIRDSVSK